HDLYSPARRNSAGVEFGDRTSLAALVAETSNASGQADAAPVVGGTALAGIERPVLSPIDGTVIGRVREGDATSVGAAMAAAAAGFADWQGMPVEARAAALERAANMIEVQRGPLISLLQREGGKTLDDALAEVREAADFCRYYAAEARRTLVGRPMPGPTG